MQFYNIKLEDIDSYIPESTIVDGTTMRTIGLNLKNGDSVCIVYDDGKEFLKACSMLKGV